MKNNYSNNKRNQSRPDNNRSRDSYPKGVRNNNRVKGEYKNEFKSFNNTDIEKQKLKGDFDLSKNPAGFLIISIFIPGDTSFEVAWSTIQSAISSEHKKKIVISVENNKDLLNSLKKKFDNAFGIFFFTPKIKMGDNHVVNSSIVHQEVLNSFKSHFFMTLIAGINLRPFSLEKMLSFLAKPGDTVAVSPKFYTSDGEIIKSCKRFFTFSELFNKGKEIKEIDNPEHFMMERGEIGYYSIHRIDYGSLDCMLFLSNALIKAGGINVKSCNKDFRDAQICKKLAKKGSGKVIFYPHARVISNIEGHSLSLSMIEKLKYVLS